MCDAIGHPVVRLRRVRIGPIADDRLKPGEFRELTATRARALFRSAQRLNRPAFAKLRRVRRSASPEAEALSLQPTA